MEGAVVNLLSPGDKALVVTAGKFGERWVALCKAFGIDVNVISIPYGQSVNPEQVAEASTSYTGQYLKPLLRRSLKRKAG